MKMREGKEQKKWNCPWKVKEDNRFWRTLLYSATYIKYYNIKIRFL